MEGSEDRKPNITKGEGDAPSDDTVISVKLAPQDGTVTFTRI